MKVHNHLHWDHPYYRSKTRNQWRKEGRGILPDAAGEEMWTNQCCGDTAIYYKMDETYPATDDEIAAWKQQDREARKERRRQRLEEERLALEREQERERRRKEALKARIRRYSDIQPADIICLDTETTGLDCYDDEILQLSIIDGLGEPLFNDYICPTAHDEWPEAERINGISPEMVADKPHISDHVSRINQILAHAKLIVGYNLTFDLDFLFHAGIKTPTELKTFDVMDEFAEIYGEWNDYYKNYRWQKLCVCADYYGYQGGDFHDSLEDVKATLHCYYAMQRYGEARNDEL